MADPAIDIPNLLYRYAELMDAAQFADCARLFDHGCLVAGGREVRGAERIVQFWRRFVRIQADGTLGTRHLVTNPQIALAPDGQSARCRSQWTVLQQAAGLPLQVIGSGRYRDEFALIDGGWCFTRREYAQVDFWGDTSAHLLDTGTGTKG